MSVKKNKLKVAIIGSGNIGTDLLIKCLRSELLDCTFFIGRSLSSPGIAKAKSLGVKISDQSIQAIVNEPDSCDLVFDATSAKDAIRNWAVLKPMNKVVVDMTPAKIGIMCIPAVNIEEAVSHQNINMVTCGGQASVPIAHVIGNAIKDIAYIEVVSSIASRSAGPATRANLDEYIETTEAAIKKFSNANTTKAILNLNPAFPCIDMQTTIFAKVKDPDMKSLLPQIEAMVKKIKAYVPGYNLLVQPIYEHGRIAIMVKVQGLGDYLPKFAGNLDIINCAAIAVAERFAEKRNRS
ncbi:MAG TPA: acetaldehyde dehydrogenase (acetylating) [Bacteroidia bacterium]